MRWKIHEIEKGHPTCPSFRSENFVEWIADKGIPPHARHEFGGCSCPPWEFFTRGHVRLKVQVGRYFL